MRRKLAFLRPSHALAVGFAALFAFSGGFAIAARSSGPVIRACANRKSGVLRLASKCRKGERSVSWNKEGLPGPRGLAGVAGQPGANGTKGERGEQGPQGPGAISFDTTIPGESPAEPRRLAGPVDGIEVSVVCNSASKEVFVSVGVTSGKNSLQAAGTDSAGPTGSPVTSLDSTGGASVLKHDGFSADLDVVVADSTIGKTVHVDVHGEYGEPSCRAWGIAIPAS